MTTATDIINRALRKISSNVSFEGTDGNSLTDAFNALNDMLGAWSAEKLLPPSRTLENFPLVIGTASYTIGSGANFNTTRSDEIQRGSYLLDSNGISTPLTPITRREYDEIPLKTVQGLPDRFYYDPQYPNGVIYFYPTPVLAYTFYLDSLKPFTQFTSLTMAVNLPPEYTEALIYNLAVRLADDYGFDCSQITLSMAGSSLAKIRAKNAAANMQLSDFDPMTYAGKNWRRNWNIYNI